MPPKSKFSKEQIIDVAFDIAKKEGIGSITIRKIALKLESSIAPIYVNFKDVDELKRAVISKIQELGNSMISEQNTGDPFLDIGIASIKFAKNYSVIFKEFLLKGNKDLVSNDEEMTQMVIQEMKKDSEFKIFSEEELRMIFMKLRIFQAGLSIMAANEAFASQLTDDVIIEMLNDTGIDILNGMKSRKINSKKL